MTEQLTLSPDDMRRLGYRVIDLIVDHLEDLPHSKALNIATPASLQRALTRTLPEAPCDMLEVLEQLCGMPDGAGGTFLSGGTTNTGAVDPLRELAALCEEHGLWLHVDGAYGAGSILSERGQAELDGIGLAHSITVDPLTNLQTTRSGIREIST